MSLKLVFLGRLEDVAGHDEREVQLAAKLGDVLAALEPELATALRGDRIKVAVNGALIQDWTTPLLKDGDEIAFLPPVSGG